MKFLADECCDFSVVKALRESGYDVAVMSEISKGALDKKVLEISLEEQRILITEDKDFGELVYAYQRRSIGVILLRFPSGGRAILSKALMQLLEKNHDSIKGKFVVIQPGKIRVTK
ncbi:MAG TPA: DUF5615 family PIN-like protein [Bdellovibrionota bacterium]|nr:DUF5615 family PIN-like protein [Bdellovibrionota bacterium]